MKHRFIQGNADIIKLNRGDDFSAAVFINVGDNIYPKQYSLNKYDRLYFGVMLPNDCWEHSLIRKVYTSDAPKDHWGNTIITLNSLDTEYVQPGTYYYMIRLLKSTELLDSLQSCVSAPEFQINKFFKATEEGGFEELLEEPEDWYINWQQYYSMHYETITVSPKTLFYVL